MTADLTGKLPRRTQKIRITTNLQIYWDNILISRTDQPQGPHPERSRSSGGAKDLSYTNLGGGPSLLKNPGGACCSSLGRKRLL